MSANAGESFHTVATIKGSTYRLSGSLKQPTDGKDVFVKFDYQETVDGRGTTQISTNVGVAVDKPMRVGGMNAEPERSGTALILTLKRR